MALAKVFIIYLILIFFIYQQIMILEDGNNIYSIFYFLHIQKIYLKKIS